LLVDREFKEEVEEFLDTVFERMPEMENQPEHFTKPQRGGKPQKKNRAENISNFLKKLEESVVIDQMLTDEDSEYSVSPPTRSRRPTISYAQATKRLSFQNEMILGTPNETSTQQTNNTATTNMSTLTQNSLDAAIQQIRKETEKSINDLRQEMRTEVKNMEQSIAATVIAAIQATNPINMEVEQENRSTGSSSQDTTATIKLMMDRFDALTQVLQNLATQIKEITESQDSNANKRSRSLTTAVRQTQNTTTTNSSGNRSPPAKVPRPMAPTPPSMPPPKELQKNKTGAQGGK
jgi:chemotaxis protein histidine kinase CheA